MSVMGRSVNKVRIIIKVDISPLKVLLLVSDFKKLEFMPQVLVTEYQISRKYLQRERIVQAEGWKDGRKEGRPETELRVACSNFVKAPRMELYSTE